MRDMVGATLIGPRIVQYRMVLFSVTFSIPNYRQSIPFSTFCIAIYSSVVSGARDFRFDKEVDGSKC